jgi:hypothetical protein
MLLVLDNEGDNDSITKTVKAYNHRPVAGFEIINPPGGDTTANDIEYYVDAAAAEAAGVADPDLWVADDVVYGDLDVDSVGTPANIVVVIRSKQIPDERWRQLTNTDNQATLRTATTSATSSATPAVPTGYLSHNFSYDPEGQVWIDSPDDHVAPFWPDWFPNQAWGIRYLYIDWGDNTSQDQVVYADYADDYASGDVVVEHTYLDVDTAGGTVFEIGVTAEDWLGYRSAEFTRRVTLKAGYESSEAEI